MACKAGISNGRLCCVQNWDINEELPAEAEGPFHVAVATNVLHTGKNLKSESISPSTAQWCPVVF